MDPLGRPEFLEFARAKAVMSEELRKIASVSNAAITP
jgi:hypothetical protein